MYKYSTAFQKIINSPALIDDLLKNCSFRGSFESWERRKAFISKAINTSGTIMDIGSGNGFLLRSLQEWSSYELVPHGIDINQVYIEKAKELFPYYAQNFTVLDARNTDRLIQYGLPNKFDFVYFSNKWATSQSEQVVDDLLKLVRAGGRLILGFYDDSKEANQTAAKALRLSGQIENPQGMNLVGWINKFG